MISLFYKKYLKKLRAIFILMDSITPMVKPFINLTKSKIITLKITKEK